MPEGISALVSLQKLALNSNQIGAGVSAGCCCPLLLLQPAAAAACNCCDSHYLFASSHNLRSKCLATGSVLRAALSIAVRPLTIHPSYDSHSPTPHPPSAASLPDSIGRLSSLRALSLCHNQLAAVPAALGGCRQLEELDLSQNQIQEIPDSLSSLQSLKLLNLDKNM